MSLRELRWPLVPAFCGILLAITVGCGGGGSGGRESGSAGADFGCSGSCTNQALTEAEVRSIVQRGVGAASALGVGATIAVVDRVGNVLALYQTPGAPTHSKFSSGLAAQGGFEGVSVPAGLAAISKAGTGAYLSSQGNAFSSRTASQIIQEHFDPGERDQGGGPLFGVQFSQLLCGDVVRKFNGGDSAGPKALPLGLSGDPGGLPLYKQGDLVGGVGVEFDGVYGLDLNIRDRDEDPEELVAMQSARDFAAPSSIVAPNIIAAGRALRYSDVSFESLPELGELPPLDEVAFVGFPGLAAPGVRGGTTFGTPASGVTRSARAGKPSMILTDAGGGERFPVRGGAPIAGGLQLTGAEVNALLDSALLTAERARAAIRRPRDSQAHVSIWVVDTQGNPLGFTRTFDAPVFGIDVSLQKARTAALFSSPDARGILAGGAPGAYVARTDAFLGAGALQGQLAISARAVGNLARPFFPDGIEGTPAGPFSLPFPGGAPGVTWSPFNDGLQLDLVFGRVNAALGALPSGGRLNSCSAVAGSGARLANGIQIFPGAVPLYRGSNLIGAIGISGDGIDQDDLVAFFGASRPGLDHAGHSGVGDPELGFNAPKEIRADQQEILVDQTIRLRYVNCPEAPFRGSDEQQVCDKL